MGNMAVHYFQQLFNSSISTNNFPEVIYKNIISEEGKCVLNNPFTSKEVKNALWSISDDSTPGPDGFNSKFYKLHWERLNGLIVTSMQHTFESGKIINEINHSVISLIPKVKTPKDMSDYRPISCCNTIYKILSKILCNRMKWVINELISDNQFAFLPSRNIHDGIMLAHESIKDFNKKGVGKMCIKVDLKKAYETINRHFILHM